MSELDDRLPDELQALAAGYVLGDLSSEEMADFQARLTTDPDLAQMVTDLRSTLAMLPYGLPQQMPGGHVRSKLLTSAQSASPPQLRSHRWDSSILRSMAAITVLMTGFGLFLTYRMTRLQTQLATQPSTTSLSSNRSADSAVTVYPADSILAQQWGGLAQLVQDHTGSLDRSQGPVDVPANQPNQLSDQLAVDLMPTLAMAQAELLGGSPCQFDQAKGVRLTYQLPRQQTVSVYQIDLNGDQFPKLSETHVTLNHNNVNLILWRENNYLYAIAASMPVSELEALAQSLEFI